MRSRLLLVTLLAAFGLAPGTAGPAHRSSEEAQLSVRVKAQQERIEQLRHLIRMRSGAAPTQPVSRGGSFQRGRRYSGYRRTQRTTRPYRKYSYTSGKSRPGRRSYGWSKSTQYRRAPGRTYSRTAYPSTSRRTYSQTKYPASSKRTYSQTRYPASSKRTYAKQAYPSTSGRYRAGKRSYGWWNGYKWVYGTDHGRYRSGRRSYAWNNDSYYRRAPGRTYSRTPSVRKPASAPRQTVAAARIPIKPPSTRPAAPHAKPAAGAALPRASAPAQQRPFGPTLPPPVAGVTAAELPKAPETLPAGERSVALVSFGLLGFVALFGVYTLRHYYFTINRLFGIQRHPYLDVDTANWPAVSVFVDARGDATGSVRTLGALLEAQYPADKLRIRVVPPSADGRAREMLEEYARRFGGRLSLCDRAAELPCGTAALSATAAGEEAEILLYFEAGCVPGKGLIKQLVAPFFDPEIGAVMGRPVTANVGSSLLTRLLDLELSGGYQVDQQASMNWDQVVRIGGPVGGMRRSALESIGGWGDDAAGEVDLGCRLLLKGWKTVYENRAECYEDVPESWAVQAGRVTCCAWQYHRSLLRHGLSMLTSRQLGWGERWEGLLQLGSYAASLLLVVAWLFVLGLLFLGANPFHAVLALLVATWLGGLGSTPTVFGIAAAAHLDGHRRRIRLLPLHLLYALVSLVAVAAAAVSRPRRVPRTAESLEAALLPQECV